MGKSARHLERHYDVLLRALERFFSSNIPWEDTLYKAHVETFELLCRILATIGLPQDGDARKEVVVRIQALAEQGPPQCREENDFLPFRDALRSLLHDLREGRRRLDEV